MNAENLSLLKGTSAVQQYLSQIRVFLNLCLHQQLKLDNSLNTVHAKRFVLITDFPAGRHLEMWHVYVVVPVSTLDKNNSNERLGVRHSNATTSHFKMAARRNSVIKTNRLAWIIYRVLPNMSCWYRYQLRKTLIRD